MSPTISQTDNAIPFELSQPASTFSLPPFLTFFFSFFAPKATPRKGIHKFVSRIFSRLSVLPLCLVLVLVVGNVWGQITEDFETGLRTSGYAGNGTNTGTLTLSSGGWTFVNSGLRNSTNFYSGLYSCQIQSGTSNSATLPTLNTCGSISFWFKGGIPTLKKTVSGVTTTITLTTGSTVNTFTNYTAAINDASSSISLTIYNSAATSYLDYVTTTTYSPPAPSITLADNGSQVSASSVAAGSNNVILHQSSIAVTTANAALTAVSFTTAGTYASADISNFKVWYSADNSFATTGDNTQLGSTITTSLGAGAKSVSSLNQAINSGSTGYIFITTDIVASPTGGNTINVSALTTSDVTFSSGTKSGSTAAGGAKTLQAASSPTITTSGTLSAVNTTYGTASASPTNFSVSGSALTNDITITPPSGFEVSTTIGSGYTTSLTLAQGSGSVASTTIYVRLAATTAVGSYSGNISVASTGATTQNVATVSSAVSTKALTITGLTASNKVYDATITASLSGTAAYSGLVNGESFSVTGTPSATFATKTVGTGKAVTVTGYTAPSANYTVTQPTGLTATITAKTLTVTGAAASNKTYDGTTTATISGTLSGVIAGDVVTLTGTGTFASANVGTGIVVTSASTLAGADNANYTLTQPTGLSANITQASQTIVFGALPAKTTADAAFACGATSATSGTNALTYSSSNTLVATINASGTITIVGAGTTSITVSQAGSANYSAAADVAQTLTVTVPPCFSENFSSASSGDNTTTGGQSSTWNGGSNFTGTLTNVYQAGGAVKLGVSAGTGSMTSALLSGVSGDVTVSFDVKGWTTVEGNISVTLNGSTQTVTYTAVMSGSFENKSVQFIGVPSNSTLTFATTAKRAFIDNIVLTCQASSSVPQAVSTSAASSIVNTTAILNGNLTTVGVSPNTTEKGFVYAATATNGTPQVGGTGVTKTSVAGISTGAYTLSLAGLITSTGYSFRAYAYDGTNYTYGSILTFTTLTVATKLGFGTTPPAVGSISTNLTTFTVQALRSDNTLDTEFSGSITVAKASGPGNIAGTLTATASSGVATFSSVQFDALGDYTIIASSGALTTVTSSTISILAYAVGDYRTKQNGNWGTSSTWEKWDGSAWNACSSADVPDVSTASVTIQSGHIIDNDGTTGYPWDVNNLTVESGGKVWDNQFGGINTYIQIYGDIICNGTIGDPNGDDISFDIAGGNDCSISGTGSFTATRIRKDADINSNTDASLSFDMDVRLTWSSNSGTVLYNDAGTAVSGNQASQFNITVTSGKTVRCSGPGAVTSGVSIDGLYGGSGSSDNTGGVYTIYGTLDMDGAFYSSNNNSTNTTSLIIKNGGTVKCRYIETGSSGASGNTLRIESGGKLNIFGSVDTITLTLNDITWNGYSTTNNTWDLQSGSTIEYSGATQQKVNGIASCSNFTVSGGGLKKLGNDFTVAGILTLTSGRIQTDAYKLIHTSTSASDLTHSSGSSSFIFGTYRRYITSNTSSYEMPVGLSSSTSGYRRADLINNGLAGLSYIDASVRSVAESGNNVDSRITSTQEGTTLTDVIGNTVWSLVPNSSPSGGSYGVRLYVNGTGLTTADDNTFCAVKRNDGSTDYADWNTFFSTTSIPSNNSAGRIYNSGNGYAERLGYTSFSEHAIGKSPSNQPLPVGLTSFEVSCQEGAVLVKWSTATESNSAYFTIERSIDGTDWNVAGVLSAAGNSMETLAYEFNDRIESGIAYYRLIQVDVDGQETEFEPVSVICNSKEVELVTLPNPSGKEFTIMYSSLSGDEEVEIQISDAHGKSLLTKYVIVTEGVNLISIADFTGVSGTYFVKVTEADGSVKVVRHQIF